MARQGEAWVWQGWVWRGEVRPGDARRGRARVRRGQAWPGKARHGEARPGMAWRGEAGIQQGRDNLQTTENDMIKVNLSIQSAALGLMMHNRRLANPLDPIVRQMKKLSHKRANKTDDDLEELSRLEFEGGLYIDENGPYIPDEWLESMLRDGAKRVKKGKETSSAVMCSGPRYYLQYDGPRTVDELWERGDEFVDVRAVTVMRNKIMRTRPIFRNWSLDFSVDVDETTLDPEQVIDFAKTGGRLKGLGDYRPKYGRFVVKDSSIGETLWVQPKKPKKKS